HLLRALDCAARSFVPGTSLLEILVDELVRRVPGAFCSGELFRKPRYRDATSGHQPHDQGVCERRFRRIPVCPAHGVCVLSSPGYRRHLPGCGSLPGDACFTMDRLEADVACDLTSGARPARGILCVVDADAAHWGHVSNPGQSGAVTMDRQRPTNPGHPPMRSRAPVGWRHGSYSLSTVIDSGIGRRVC